MAAENVRLIEREGRRVFSPETGLSRQVLAYNGKLLVRHLMEKGRVGARHSHPHEQLVYIVHGRIHFEGGDKGHAICYLQYRSVPMGCHLRCKVVGFAGSRGATYEMVEPPWTRFRAVCGEGGPYAARPMRCTRSWKRGSERKGSKAGRMSIDGLKCCA
jgi:mannose-6-phosphate isomerase-like protein (cupin superfamily)